MRMRITNCFLPMEVERSLVEQRIVLSHELATNTLRGGRFHDHYRNLETQRTQFRTTFHNPSELKITEKTFNSHTF